jgi:hypothetical protein
MFPPHSTLILLSTGVGVGLVFAGINRVKALYWTAVINGLLAPSFSPPGVSCLLCKLPISPPSSRRLAGCVQRSGPPAVLFASTQQQPELPHLAKLIVRTVQFGPAEPFFPSLCCIYREMISRRQGRCSGLLERNNGI